MKTVVKVVGWIALILLVALVVLFFVGKGDADPSSSAFYAAQSAVQRKLNVPASAVFDARNTEGNSCSLIAENMYLAFGRVQSQNLYGVMIPNKWVVLIEDKADGYGIAHMAIGDEEVMAFWADVHPFLTKAEKTF
jgi:hypothetical protein